MLLKRISRLILQFCCFCFKAQSICHRGTLFWWGSSHHGVTCGVVPSTQRHSLFPWKNEQEGTSVKVPCSADSRCFHCTVNAWFQLYSNNKSQCSFWEAVHSKKHTLAAPNSVSRNEPQLWAVLQKNVSSSLCRINSYSIISNNRTCSSRNFKLFCCKL